MKQLVTLVLGAGILFGAYAITFGVPDAVVRYFGSAGSAEAAVAPAGGQGASGAAGGPGGAGGPGRRGSQATTVVLSTLEERSYALVLSAIGSASSRHNVEVVASVSGEVTEVYMTPNAMVEKGDVLLRLDDRAERLALEIAETERDAAQATVDRYTALRASGNLTVTDVSLAEAEVALRLAEANLALAEVELDDRTIRAPISGRLGLTTYDEATYVSSGDKIVTIDDATTLVAEFEVPERSIGLLEAGKTVLVGTPTYAGRVFEGTITAFDSRLDSVTRSATVQAEIDNSEGLLLSGMTFTVRMIEDTEPMPVVPSTALTWARSGAGIWVADGGTVTRQPVAIRYREGDEVWIDTDLPLGTAIVAEGAAKLREGAAITDANAAPRTVAEGPRS